MAFRAAQTGQSFLKFKTFSCSIAQYAACIMSQLRTELPVALLRESHHPTVPLLLWGSAVWKRRSWPDVFFKNPLAPRQTRLISSLSSCHWASNSSPNAETDSLGFLPTNRRATHLWSLSLTGRLQGRPAHDWRPPSGPLHPRTGFILWVTRW